MSQPLQIVRCFLEEFQNKTKFFFEPGFVACFTEVAQDLRCLVSSKRKSQCNDLCKYTYHKDTLNGIRKGVLLFK